MEFKFDLGDRVQDKITKFEGIVTARSQWFNACNTYGVQSEKLDSSGKPLERAWFDEPQLALMKHKAIEQAPLKRRKTGGPAHPVPSPNRTKSGRP